MRERPVTYLGATLAASLVVGLIVGVLVGGTDTSGLEGEIDDLQAELAQAEGDFAEAEGRHADAAERLREARIEARRAGKEAREEFDDERAEFEERLADARARVRRLREREASAASGSGGSPEGTHSVGQFLFTDVQVLEDGVGDFEVRARVENTGGSVDFVGLEASIFSGGSVVATASTIESFGAGETRTVRFIGTDDYGAWDSIEFQTD